MSKTWNDVERSGRNLQWKDISQPPIGIESFVKLALEVIADPETNSGAIARVLVPLVVTGTSHPLRSNLHKLSVGGNLEEWQVREKAAFSHLLEEIQRQRRETRVASAVPGYAKMKATKR